MCNRGLKEYDISEETGEQRTETDSVHSQNQDDADECVSSNLVCKTLYDQVERMEYWPDDPALDGEFAQDVELMKSMGLPLSFTASECHEKKVCVPLCIKTTGQTKI